MLPGGRGLPGIERYLLVSGVPVPYRNAGRALADLSRLFLTLEVTCDQSWMVHQFGKTLWPLLPEPKFFITGRCYVQLSLNRNA